MAGTIGSVGLGPAQTRPVDKTMGELGSGSAAFAKGLGALSSATDRLRSSTETLANARQGLELAQREQRRKGERSATLVRYAQARADYNEDLIRLQQEYPEDPEGYRTAADERLERHLTAFESSIPDHMKDALNPQVAEFRESARLTHLEQEISREGAFYQANLGRQVNLTSMELVRGDISLEEAEERIAAMAENSPLPAAATAGLIDGARSQVQSIDALNQASYEAQNWNAPDGPEVLRGSENAIPGMPPVARGFAGFAGGGIVSNVNPDDVSLELQMGPARPNAPNDPVLNVVKTTAAQVYGKGTRVIVTSGQEGDLPQHGSNRHKTGDAADIQIIRPDGSVVKATEMREFAEAAAANGALGLGYGTEYMGGDHIHVDLVPPGAGQSHVWASGAKRDRAALEGRMRESAAATTNFGFSDDEWVELGAVTGHDTTSRAGRVRAAWDYAQSIYRDSTNGRNMQADLESGLRPQVQRVYDVLKTAWPSFAERGDFETFFKSVTTAKPVESSVMRDDARYGNLPYSTRVGINNNAAAQAAQAAAVRAEDERLRMEHRLSQIEEQVIAGNVGLEGINQLVEANGFTPADERKLLDSYEKHQEQMFAADSLAKNLQDPTHVFGDEAQMGLDVVHERKQGAQLIAEADPNYTAQLSSLWQRTDRLPAAVPGQLEAMLKGQDPAARVTGLNLLAQLEQANPAQFAAQFNDQLRADVNEYTRLAPYYPEEVRAGRIAERHDPLTAQQLDERKKLITEHFKDPPKSLRINKIMDRLGMDIATTDYGFVSAFQAEYRTVFEQEYLRTGDFDAAEAGADKIVSGIWGTYRGTPMRLPPDKVGLPAIGDSYDYIDMVVREEAELSETDEYMLLSDAETESERGSGRASYILMVPDEFAPEVFVPVTGNDMRTLRVDIDPNAAGLKQELTALKLYDHNARAELEQSRLDHAEFLNGNKRSGIKGAIRQYRAQNMERPKFAYDLPEGLFTAEELQQVEDILGREKLLNLPVDMLMDQMDAIVEGSDTAVRPGAWEK